MRQIVPMLLAGAAMGQPWPEVAPTAQVQAALAARPGLEGATAWQGDVNRDGVPDLIVQAGYALGQGNAFVLSTEVWLGLPGAHVRVGFLALPESGGPGPAGILGVEDGADGPILTLARYLDGDGRCCPSGQRLVPLDRLTLSLDPIP